MAQPHVIFKLLPRKAAPQPQTVAVTAPVSTATPKTTKRRNYYSLPDGVSYHIRAKRYVARGYRNGEVTWLGSFKTVAQASKAVQSFNDIASCISGLIASQPTQEQIAARAYELYVARGSVDGFAEQDWQEAERQLRQAR